MSKRHEQGTEYRSTTAYREDGTVEQESEAYRAVCRTCLERDDEGEPRAADWPCPTVRALRAVAVLNALVLAADVATDASRAAVREALA